ncbi:hypothetical protein P7H62_14550 [Vagococcus carniphilus]|uniref:hypothetical protein n=1 Tax=Vagococcus carniphilus TaxID=218144 RepID=UPI00288F17DB|nr:hypothetical protein [Vagococcus carniphilus]MDT2832211.1 hypothetical protein [Vagococcus carniphilus]MDT2840705.1 hypothetical protein [Vagococcus carniphilus]MDT2855683.1 hypothetical protein [Vagococcus carniphilus]
MTDIAEITENDRNKIKKYVEETNNINFTMLAERFKISKSQMSKIMSGKDTSVKATQTIDSIVTMYDL